MRQFVVTVYDRIGKTVFILIAACWIITTQAVILVSDFRYWACRLTQKTNKKYKVLVTKRVPQSY